MSRLFNNYAGFLVDTHISDDDDSFLSRLSPDSFVQSVKRTGSDSVIVYAACCMGNYYYQSKATNEKPMKTLADNYAAFLIDSHITEDHESFLSKLEPKGYVDIVRRTQSDSAFVYAACHNANYYYPSPGGHQHKGLKGRDFFGETVALLRKHGITPRAYCTVVYQRRIARANPHFRISQVDGAQNYRRSWYCCPNSLPYRNYACQHIREICAYDIESIFIDMTFWPGICVCSFCRDRFKKEYDREFPAAVDWNDPKWVEFQRARERWLAEFAHELTAAAKSVRPNIAVAHQFSPVLLGWMYGQTHALAMANDIPSGDFYGGRHQHRFGAKVLAAFEKELPFEFMTSRCVNLYDHTSTKSDDELLASCATTLANGGTYLLIDAINPDGSLEPDFYDRAEQLANTLKPFRNKLRELQPKLVADTGVYFSMASYVRRDHNGTPLRQLMNPINNMLAVTDLRPLQEALGTSMALNRARMPYRVVTDHTSSYSGLRTIIANDASFLAADEVDRLRDFVQAGGTLIATGLTSYYDINGDTTGDFALADVFGVRYTGRMSKQWSYVAPLGTSEMLSNDVPCPLVKETSAKRLASVAEPLFDYDDLDHFAAYHSNPPGPPGEFAAVTVNQFGKGKCIYLYSSLLARQHHAQIEFGAKLFRDQGGSALVHECTAPPAVEVTLLRGTRRAGYLLCFVNFQDESPAIPVHNLRAVISLHAGVKAVAARRVSNDESISFERIGDRLTFELPVLQCIEMIEIQTEED